MFCSIWRKCTEDDLVEREASGREQKKMKTGSIAAVRVTAYLLLLLTKAPL